MADPAPHHSHSASAIPAHLQALRQRNLAWLRTSGMSGLLVVLIVGVFVLPAIVCYGAAWRLAADVIVTLVLVSGVAAVADHRKVAVLHVMLTA